MKQYIRKYPLSVSDYAGGDNELYLPKGYKILSVHLLHGMAHAFVLVDIEEPISEKCVIVICGTWNEITQKDPLEQLQYINTFFSEGGEFVFHAFERIDYKKRRI